VKFATFFYPGYTNCARRNAAAGRRMDEWDLVRENRPSVFTGTDPIIPLLGYTDSAAPAAMEQEAELADAYGVDAFIFNYYFDGASAQLDLPLKTFSAHKRRLSFALNICCHLPKHVLPYGLGEGESSVTTWLTEEQFAQLGRIAWEKYISRPNYLTVDGLALVAFYHVGALLNAYGRDGLKRRMQAFRTAVRNSGTECCLVGLASVMGAWRSGLVDPGRLPFDAYSCYVALPDFGADEPVQRFEEVAGKWLASMKDISASTDSPLFPCVGAGWNATARGELGYDPGADGLRFPYHPVVVGDTPEAFERYLRNAAHIALGDRRNPAGLVFLGPWNEWSEGCYLLPDTRFGYGKLEAIRKVKSEIAGK
jgi:Glycosyltransferase WbsX